MDKKAEEPDVVLEDDIGPAEDLTNNLPDGVNYDPESEELIVYGQRYGVDDVVSQVKSRAKEKGPATFGLTVGGVTLGLLIGGPITGAAAATTGSIIGALYDREYIEFSEDGISINKGNNSEHIDPNEDTELRDPLEVHNDKWYEPESDIHVIAIELPDGERRYYKTETGAANRLIDEYGV
jgi:hypothetical protein